MSCWPKSWSRGHAGWCGNGSPTRSGGPRAAALCSRSTSTGVAFPTSKKTIGQFSSLSLQTAAGNFLLRDIVLECCLKENGNKFDLHTAVVMPDHAHLLLSPLRGADGWNFSLPQIMHAIKGASARFFDHVLRSNDSLAEKVDYICQNPVRAGLVKVEG